MLGHGVDIIEYFSLQMTFTTDVFKPPPPIGAGGGYMFSGRPSAGLGSLLYFSTSLQSKKVLGKSNEVQVESTLLENYLSKK